MKKSTHIPELHTSVTHLEYDFIQRHGYLYMPANCCCDATGCVNLFKRIDPKVRVIDCFAGNQKDTVYFRTGKGESGSAFTRIWDHV